MLHVYNSMTHTKEPFQPLRPGKIGLYVCGITVYDLCHLGHARVMVAFDVMVRFLRAAGFEVTYVRNITDIDDKIIARAIEQGVAIDHLTSTYIDAMYRDADALGILRPDIEPRATQHITEVIQLIQQLFDKGYAYVGSNGDVYYRVAQFTNYGKLSRKDLDGLMAGARVAVALDKDSPLDFVLWKSAKAGEPSWPSPWGQGRPGWHIECSAMALGQLGQPFDMHGGGLDLQFPHHENEIAQSEAATDKTFANYWVHVGLLQINQEKMSKSLHNFLTIQDVLDLYHPEVVRYFLLSSQYRSSLNYSADTLDNAHKSLARLYQTLKDIEVTPCELDPDWQEQFFAAMYDDFNTPVALAVLFQLSHAINKTKSVKLAYTLKYLAGILGILQSVPTIFLQAGLQDAEIATINHLVADRDAARLAKNWVKADEIRQMLLAKNVEIEDSSSGSTWRIIETNRS